MKHIFHEIPFPVSEHHQPDNIRRPSRFMVVLGLTLVFALLFVAAFAPLLAPFSQTAVVGGAFSSSDGVHLLGTDFRGRDMLSRLIFGLRDIVGVAFITAVFSLALGLFTSIIAVMFGRWLSGGLFILAHAISGLPALFWAFLYLALAGPSGQSLVVVLTLALSARVFRLCSSGSVEATLRKARDASMPDTRFLWLKILRAAYHEEKVVLAAMFGIVINIVILIDFSLSFLGMGVQPPFASLGSMVRENAILISFEDYTPLLPFAVVILLVISVYLLIDCLLRQSGRQIVPSIRSFGPVWDIQK
jgi:peptide/nickel transport system permease protein